MDLVLEFERIFHIILLVRIYIIDKKGLLFCNKFSVSFLNKILHNNVTRIFSVK